MKGIVITTENKMKVVEFEEPLYKTIGAAVDGWIEVVHPRGLADPFCMVVNDEGLLKQLPLNTLGCILYGTAIHGSPIVGDVVLIKEGFTKAGERDFIGLEDEDINMLGAMVVGITGGKVTWEATSDERY